MFVCDEAIRSPPFEIREEGWGEFEMEIILTAVEKGGDYSFMHDLNFKSESYEGKHVLVSPFFFSFPFLLPSLLFSSPGSPFLSRDDLFPIGL